MRLTMISTIEEYPSDEGRVVTTLFGFLSALISSASVKAVPSCSGAISVSVSDLDVLLATSAAILLDTETST